VFGHVHVHRGWLGVAGIPVGSRRELPSRLVALTVSAAVLAAACRKPAPVETIDLTAEFAHAEVCPVAGGRCAHGRRAAELLGIDARSAATIVNLPVGAGTNVYLRLPEASRVSLEFRAVDADVVVRATAAGGRPRVLGRATAADWRRIDVATAEPAGTIVQLAFAAEGHAGGGPGMVLVRNAIVMGRRTRTPAIVRRSSATPNVVLYVVDTLRADRLGCYGYPAPTSPRIDAFATSAIRFTQAVAQSSWTRSSTASIFTGVVPPRHGALEAEHAIRPKLPTLPVLLQAGGYATAAFVVNPVVSGAFGFARGFDVFRMFPATAKRPEMFLPSDRLEHRLERWLAHAPRPFFLYVHVADPHLPYGPPRRFARRLVHAAGTVTAAAMIAAQRRCPTCLHDVRDHARATLSPDAVTVLGSLYDADVALADAAFGRFVDALERAGRLDDTVVVLTADHGEEFLEHGGLTHGQTLYREVLHVPLLVRLPGAVSGTTSIDRIVQQVDLLPTILELAGLDVPPGLDGASLLRGEDDGREALSYLHLEGREVVALTDDRWAFIQDRVAHGALEIYDWRADPLEQHDVGAADVALAGYAARRFAEPWTIPEPGPAVDPAALDRLRALGYVGP